MATKTSPKTPPIKEEQLQALCRQFPATDIKTRDLSGQKLYYLDGYTVLKRLNEVMEGSYDFHIGQVITTEKTVDVSGTLTLRWIDGSTTTVSDFGSSDVLYNAKGGRVNDPYKSAVKDLWKRCLAVVGVGADLYDAEYREGLAVRLKVLEEEEAEKAFLTCQICKGEIKAGSKPKADGTILEMTARVVATSTRQKFGKRMCLDCGNKAAAEAAGAK